MRELGHSLQSMGVSDSDGRYGRGDDSRSPSARLLAYPNPSQPPVAPLDTSTEPMFPDSRAHASLRRPRPSSPTQPMPSSADRDGRRESPASDHYRHPYREPLSNRPNGLEGRDDWDDGIRRGQIRNGQQIVAVSESSGRRQYIDDRHKNARPPSPVRTPSPPSQQPYHANSPGRGREEEYSPDYYDPSEHHDYESSRPRRPQHGEQGTRRDSLDEGRGVDYGDDYNRHGPRERMASQQHRERRPPTSTRSEPMLQSRDRRSFGDDGELAYSEEYSRGSPRERMDSHYGGSREHNRISSARNGPDLQTRGRYADEYQDVRNSSEYGLSQHDGLSQHEMRQRSPTRHRGTQSQNPGGLYSPRLSVDGGDNDYRRRRYRERPLEAEYRDGDDSYYGAQQQQSLGPARDGVRVGTYTREFEVMGGGSDRGSVCSSELDSDNLPIYRGRSQATVSIPRSRQSEVERLRVYNDDYYDPDQATHQGLKSGKRVGASSPRRRPLLAASPKSRRMGAAQYQTENDDDEGELVYSFERLPLAKSKDSELDYERNILPSASFASSCYEIEMDDTLKRPKSPRRAQNVRSVSFSPSTELPEEEESYQSSISALRTPTRKAMPPRLPPTVASNSRRVAEAKRIREESEARHQILNEIKQAMEMRESACDRADEEFWDRQITTLNEALKKFSSSRASHLGVDEELSDARDENSQRRGTSWRSYESRGRNERYEAQYESRQGGGRAESVRVRAPQDLPEGHRFTARMNGNRITATVPRGGVLKGEVFTVQAQPDDEYEFAEVLLPTRTIKVRAPAHLDEGCRFSIKRGDETINAIVPKGGVRKGEVFSVAIDAG